MSVKFPNCCAALKTAVDVDMAIIDAGEIAWFVDGKNAIGQQKVETSRACPFCGAEEDGKVVVGTELEVEEDDSAKPAMSPAAPCCQRCGGRLVDIMERFPGEPPRYICPWCIQNRPDGVRRPSTANLPERLVGQASKVDVK